MIPTHFCDYLPFGGLNPLFEQFLILFTQGWFVPGFIEIGLLVLEDKIFFQCKHMTFPIALLPTPTDHDLNKLQSVLCQKVFVKI
jgi:hypothetical protein